MKNTPAEFGKSIRNMTFNEYDLQWLNALKKRIIHGIDEYTKNLIIKNAKNDIRNMLNWMYPAKQQMNLYRTAWIDDRCCAANAYPYLREYKSLKICVGDTVRIHTISSFSLTPYRESENVGSSFYRYQIFVPTGKPILELDPFITHNEDGEVLLPPMEFLVKDICASTDPNCKGIVNIEHVSPVYSKES